MGKPPMKLNTARCIIITNPSGVAAAGAINRLIDAGKELGHGGALIPIDMDERLIIAHEALFPGDLGNLDNFESTEAHPMVSLIRRPQPYLRQLWRKCLAKIAGKYPQGPDDTLLLNFHAANYHTWSRDLFSPVAIADLQRWAADSNQSTRLEFTSVVTLIDDVYDVYVRLRQRRQLASGVGVSGQPSRHAPALFNELTNLLRWRETELHSAGLIADALEVPHFLLAVKHDARAAAKLIIGGARSIYLSHPISKPRRALANGDEATWTELVRQVQCVSEALTEGKSFAPLFPTAIDELRIARETRPLGDGLSISVLVPALTRRWDYPEAHSLSSDVVGEENLLDPRRELRREPEAFVERMQPFLNNLSSVIKSQINARDHWLVGQAEAILVWRPYFKGSTASGVAEEIKYRNRLRQYRIPDHAPAFFDPTNAVCFVFHTQEDIDHIERHRMDELVNAMQEVFSDLDAEAPELPLSDEVLESVRTNPDLRRILRRTDAGSKITAENVREAIDPGPKSRFVLRQDYATEIDSGAMETAEYGRDIRTIHDAWSRLATAASVEAIEPFLDAGDYVQTLDITAENESKRIKDVVEDIERFVRVRSLR